MLEKLRGEARRQADPCHGDHADPRGRGQDHHHRRPRATRIRKLGKSTCLALREPSLGPCFGVKGGAAGGGYAQVVPMADINLHFTGDFHAITTAHNLLAAMLDNHIHQGNELDIDLHSITWKRVMDMNERALRDIVIGLGGKANGMPRQSGFDITTASEIMALLCLSKDRADLEQRLAEHRRRR